MIKTVARCGTRTVAALVSEFFEDSKTIGEYFNEAESASERQLWFSKTIRAIGVCHRSGLWQSDLHMDNFPTIKKKHLLLGWWRYSGT